jgi:glutamate:Na+ symporter, ESS family
MEFDAYALLVDLGFISLLLLVGMLVRAKIGLWQMLLVPASITAGLLGLALGPNAAGLIPFSDQIAEYPTVLIAVIFASIPLAQSFELRGIAQRAGALWSYSMAMYILQWGLGLLFALTVLGLFFDLPDGFGLMLAAGWAGGFGTAAAVGAAYQGLGWNEATTLGFTSATVGVAVCIVGGLALTKWGTKTGKTGILGDAGHLPEELRTGLVSREEDRENIGKATISPASIEPLAFSLCLVLAATMGGYYLAILGGTLLSGIEIPSFATAFVVASPCGRS